MKKIFCLLLLCFLVLAPLGAQSEARWVYVNSDNTHFERIDNSRILLEDNILVFWEELYFKDRGYSVVTRLQCDLDRHVYRSTYVLVYSRDGDPQSFDHVSKWIPIVPNSRLESTISRVLAYYQKNN